MNERRGVEVTDRMFTQGELKTPTELIGSQDSIMISFGPRRGAKLSL